MSDEIQRLDDEDNKVRTILEMLAKDQEAQLIVWHPVNDQWVAACFDKRARGDTPLAAIMKLFDQLTSTRPSS